MFFPTRPISSNSNALPGIFFAFCDTGTENEVRKNQETYKSSLKFLTDQDHSFSHGILGQVFHGCKNQKCDDRDIL